MPEAGVPAVERALDVLELLESSPTRLTLTEISQRLGLPKGSTHRLLATLRARGYLAAQGSARSGYGLGARLVSLGVRAQERLDVVRAAGEPIRQLAQATGEGCQVSVRSGRQAVCIARVPSPSHPEIALTGGIGAAFPLHAVAVGKALLAYAPEAELRALLEDALTAYTPYTQIDPTALLSELVGIRVSGIARDEQEYKLGLRALAAPIFDATGTAVAALALPLLIAGNPQDNEDPAEKHRIAALRIAAAEISRALGWRNE